jgi:hypothetical protein
MQMTAASEASSTCGTLAMRPRLGINTTCGRRISREGMRRLAVYERAAEGAPADDHLANEARHRSWGGCDLALELAMPAGAVLLSGHPISPA